MAICICDLNERLDGQRIMIGSDSELLNMFLINKKKTIWTCLELFAMKPIGDLCIFRGIEMKENPNLLNFGHLMMLQVICSFKKSSDLEFQKFGISKLKEQFKLWKSFGSRMKNRCLVLVLKVFEDAFFNGINHRLDAQQF